MRSGLQLGLWEVVTTKAFITYEDSGRPAFVSRGPHRHVPNFDREFHPVQGFKSEDLQGQQIFCGEGGRLANHPQPVHDPGFAPVGPNHVAQFHYHNLIQDTLEKVRREV